MIVYSKQNIRVNMWIIRPIKIIKLLLQKKISQLGILIYLEISTKILEAFQNKKINNITNIE